MRNRHPTHLSGFSTGGSRQVFASCPKSISVFSPPCKRIPAKKTTVSYERKDSVSRLGDFGINNEFRAKNAKTLSLPSDGRWQVYHSKRTRKKMGINKDIALKMDKGTHKVSKLSPATGANLEPLGKVRIFEPKPNIRQRRICKIPDYLMEPQFNSYNNYGVFVKWTGFGDDIERIVDWWLALYPGQVSITILENNFLAILCNNQKTKDDILHGKAKLYRGFGFFRCEWMPNFDPHSQNINKYPRWINLGSLPIEYLDFKILEFLGEQFGSFLGCEGLEKMVSNKNTKILVEFDCNSRVLEPTKLVTKRGEWNIHPTFYDGVINESDIWLKSSPALVKSIDHKENPISEQNDKITLNSIHENAICPPVTNTDENNQNNLSNINDLDKIIDEANSIKEEALVEMSKRISDSVDSLKSPSETKSVVNMGQENEADQEEMSSRMAAVLEVFNNNEVENLSPEEEAEKRFLIQELLASLDVGDNNENREGDITPLPVNDYTAAQSQLGEDDGEGVTIPQLPLGITNIYDGKNTPDCAREARSRGRKSLSELRLQDGNAKDQGKLTAFFDAGKGKGLPSVQ
ncbi:hypothetical protein SUGI_0563010 [Cryptomeria japonica]|nr:hypothetical protein SUGI_0563010 [Cryptomeria japonica]